MYRTKILLVIWVILSQKIGFSQTYLGFEVRPFFISAEGINPQISPYAFSLLVRQEVGSGVSVSIRPGFSFLNFNSKQYTGYDISIFCQYLYNKPAYIYSGLSFHNNSGAGNQLRRVIQKIITYYTIGIGFQLSSVINVEAGLYVPVANKVYSIVRNSNNTYREMEIEFLFKFGIGLEFKL
jgi:hypothetical protein